VGKIHEKIKAKQQKTEGKKVAICIPSRGEMEIGTAFDLAVMCAYDSRNREGHQAIYTVSGTLIFDQREKLAAEALKEGADYILWIDADMRFPKNTIEVLLKHDKPIVGVNATTRTAPVRPTAKNLEIDFEKSVNHWLPIVSKDKTHVEEVTAIGCGVMLVKREVFEKTPRPWFWFEQIPGGKLLGEDVYFCVKAKDAGFDTYLDHNLSNSIGHVGSYTYSWNDYNGPSDFQRPPDDGSQLPRTE
jgi:GT2 family glycosyltransferase